MPTGYGCCDGSGSVMVVVVLDRKTEKIKRGQRTGDAYTP